MFYVNPMTQWHRFTGPDVDFDERKQEVAFKELEQHFARLLLAEWRKMVPEDPLFGSDASTRLHNDMMDEAIAQEWAESGQLGIAQLLEEQMDRHERAEEARAQLIANREALVK